MPVTLNKADATPILRTLDSYFKNMIADLPDAKSASDLYEKGVPERSADNFLWNLDTEKFTYTESDVSEIKDYVKLIKSDTTMGGYPQEIKDAADELLNLIKPKMHGGRKRRTRKHKARKTRKGNRKH